jgi:hypothetical protein
MPKSIEVPYPVGLNNRPTNAPSCPDLNLESKNPFGIWHWGFYIAPTLPEQSSSIEQSLK